MASSSFMGDTAALVKALKREYIILRSIALTFVGAGIQIMFIGLSAWGLAHSTTDIPIFVLPSQNQQAPTGFAVTGSQILFYATYFLLTIIYSIAVSLAFKPKRMISPIQIQLITSSFIAVVVSVPFVLAPAYINNEVNARNAEFTVMGAFFAFTIIGFIQSEIVRRIVGLNGSLDDIDKRVYPLGRCYDEIKEIMVGERFVSLGEFQKIRDKGKGKLSLKSTARTSEKLILVLAPDASDNQKSVLAAFAYEEVFGTITKSVGASAWLDSIIAFLQIEASKPQTDQDLTSSEAYATAIKHSLEGTKPKISGIAYLPRYQITTLIATAIIAVIVVVGWQIDWLTDEAFTTTMILIAIELLFVFVPYALESIKKSSDDEE